MRENEGKINESITEYLGDSNWVWRDFILSMHKYALKMKEEIEPVQEPIPVNLKGIPTPIIGVDKIRKTRIAQYRLDYNSFGLKYEITFNEMHVERNLWENLVTLLHESLHCWQELYGNPGKSNYHNKEFISIAKEAGIKVNKKGVTSLIPDGVLAKWFEKNNIPYDVSEEETIEEIRSKKILWKCECGKGRIRADEEEEMMVFCFNCNTPLAPPDRNISTKFKLILKQIERGLA